MKKIACEIVHASYSIILDMSDRGGHGQLELYFVTAQIVKDLLKKDAYLWDGVDAQVCVCC
jgi:hypothetical protein